MSSLLTPSTTSPIQITILPNTWSPNTLSTALQIYKSFRLHALKTSPGAFAMTYEQEIQFSDDRWIQRLTNKNAIQFIATYVGDGEAWRRTPWVGSLVLVRKNDGERNGFDDGLHVDRERGSGEVVFHMNAIFLDPAVRGQGLGKKMMQAAREMTVEEARGKGVCRARITTLVDSWNVGAIGLYASQGFERKSVDEYVIDGESREAVEMECLLDVEQVGDEKSSLQ